MAGAVLDALVHHYTLWSLKQERDRAAHHRCSHGGARHTEVEIIHMMFGVILVSCHICTRQQADDVAAGRHDIRLGKTVFSGTVGRKLSYKIVI